MIMVNIDENPGIAESEWSVPSKESVLVLHLTALLAQFQDEVKPKSLGCGGVAKSSS